MFLEIAMIDGLEVNCPMHMTIERMQNTQSMRH